MALDAPRTLALDVRGPIARAELPGLAARLCARLSATDAEVVVCDVHGVEADAVAVDALARLQLAARRHHCVVLLRNASPALLDLVAFMGLGDVLTGVASAAPSSLRREAPEAGRREGRRGRCRGRR